MIKSFFNQKYGKTMYNKPTMYDTKPYETKISQAIEHFNEEIRKIRTGRAHAGMLDGVAVEVYGTKLPLNQAANITAPEAQMLLVTPFDPSNIQAITEAIRSEASLGFNPSDDGRVVRVPVPALNEERRHLLVKQLGEKVEAARIVIRAIRQDALKQAKTMKTDKKIGEDDLGRIEKELDKLVADAQQSVDEAFKRKEKDVLTI
ncbi:MAG: ribosome recycling factor [Segetibacter sp.]